ncbi:MAG: ATP-binding cassette domain-containing protein [Clostridia bacterium]|nr:ATP-binding cassette domain-containing protein [Clostridia bacterium]
MPPGGRMPYEYKKVEPPKNFKDLFRFLKEVLGGFFTRFFYVVKLVWKSGKWILFLLSFIALFQGVTPIIGSLISKNILNALQEVIRLGSLPESDFWSSSVFYLLIFLFSYRMLLRIVNNVSSALNRIAGEKVVQQVKLEIMTKSKNLDLASFDDPAFYERMENANREAGHRPLTILSETFGIVSTVIEFISYLLVLISAPGLGWSAPVVVAVALPSAIVNYIYRNKHFRYMRWRSKERRQMNYYSNLLVDKDKVKEVRMFDLADTFIGRYLSVFRTYYDGLRRLIVHESILHIAIGAVACLTNFTFYVLIARQVFTGEIMIGDYTLFTGAIMSVSNCVTALINKSGSIYEGTLFIDNLIAFMEEPCALAEHKGEGLIVPRNQGHRIEFRHVFFRYPGTERYVLNDLNFVIEPGQTLVLVGLNGTGKTTLLKLLTRLYDPTEGEILLDGKNLKDYDLKSLYRMFGIIFQDFGKYAETVEENIRFGDIHRNAEFSAVEEAAVQSAAKEYIDALPDGFNTPLMRIFEKNGIELSIGQWQKLSIARAFYSDSDVLILDEPTASLDPMAEQEIFNQFDRLREDKTTIFVSHRLSSATVADTVLVLENGCMEEIGNHEELMARKGKYYQLFSTQAERYLSHGREETEGRHPRPPRRFHEDGEERRPPRRFHEDGEERRPPRRFHEDGEERRPPRRPHENGEE